MLNQIHTSALSKTGHTSAQLFQPSPNPGFNGSQRQAELLGQLTVAEITQISQAYYLSLLHFQARQALVQSPGLLTGQGRVHWVGTVTGKRRL